MPKSKKYKIKKPKESRTHHAKWWWFVLLALPICVIVGIFGWQMHKVNVEREEKMAARRLTLSEGVYSDFEALGKEIFLPSSAPEETPIHGASYSKLAISRAENGDPKYAFGVIAVPNESGIVYDIEKDTSAILELAEAQFMQTLEDIYSAVHPRLQSTTSVRTLFGDVKAIEQYGRIDLNWSYIQFDPEDEDKAPEEKSIIYDEILHQAKYYMDIALLNNRPIISWCVWEYTVPVGSINARQSVVDSLASALGVDTQDTSGESIDALNTTIESLVYDNANGDWYNDLTGELVPEVPPIDDPTFGDKFAEYTMKMHGIEDMPGMEDMHAHSHEEMGEGNIHTGEESEVPDAHAEGGAETDPDTKLEVEGHTSA